MYNKWRFSWFLIGLILLVSCGSNPEKIVQSTQPVVPAEEKPTSPPEMEVALPSMEYDWDDRTIFAQTLNQAGQQYLNILPEASIYQISLVIPEDLNNALLGGLKVRYFNQEDKPLDEIYFRLFPNYYSGSLKIKEIEVDGFPAESQLESGDTALRVDLA